MGPTRILFVDDEVLNHWVMTADLSAAGYQVCSLCRGDEAVRLMEEGQHFDLLVTDLDLPDGMNGTDLAAIWRRLQPGRPILFTSALPQTGYDPIGEDAAFIGKYASTSDLLQIVGTLLTGIRHTPSLSDLAPSMPMMH